MDIGIAFSFVTQDDEWVSKVAIASVIVLVGFLTFGLGLIPLVGWSVEIARRVIRDEQPTLPDWSNFGGLIKDGLKVVAGVIVWFLPIIILGICAGIVGVAVGGRGNDDLGVSLVSSVISCLSIPYGILVALLLPGMVGELADHGEFGRAVNPGNAFRHLSANIGGFVIAALMTTFGMSLLQTIGAFLCLVGVLPAVAYGQAVLGHMYGQAYKQALSAEAA